MTTPREAAQVLAKCSCFDPVFSKPDTALAQGWAEAFSVYNLELDDLLAAVTKHYIESSDRAMPSHIIKHARDIRRDRTERETPDERLVRSDEIDRRLLARITQIADRKAVGNA